MLKYKRSFFRFSYLISILLILVSSIGVYRTSIVYDSLDANIKNEKVVFGDNKSVDSMLKNVSGDYTIVKDIDSKKVGKQEVLVQVKKNNISKIIPLSVNVVDITKPEIKVKSNTVKVYTGKTVDLKGNILSVTDDGSNLNYLDKATDNDREYFTITGNVNTNQVGTYPVTINAVDRANNKSSVTFNVVVEKEPVAAPINTGNVGFGVETRVAGINAYGGDMAAFAKSLVGRRYVSGGAGPYAFDCSGLVYYVYAQAGKHISRSSSSQAREGVGIDISQAQPGDIISMGPKKGGNRITHSAIYVGNGQIVHAANSGMGVRLSNLNSWVAGSADEVKTVRRVS